MTEPQACIYDGSLWLGIMETRNLMHLNHDDGVSFLTYVREKVLWESQFVQPKKKKNHWLTEKTCCAIEKTGLRYFDHQSITMVISGFWMVVPNS